jgi:hypothetical protein
MNWLRNSLIGGIVVILFLLFIRWGEFQEKQHAQSAVNTDQTTISSSSTPAAQIPELPQGTTPAAINEIPAVPEESSESDVPAQSPPKPVYSQLITVVTDNVEVVIDTEGGDIVKVALLDYDAKLNEPDPFILLNRTNSHTYIAQSG